MADRYDYDRGYESERERARDERYRERNSLRDDERYRDVRGEDRGFVRRAGDEVRSWFGDDEAASRRQRDDMRERGSASFDRTRYDRDRSFSEYPPERGYRFRDDASVRDYDAARQYWSARPSLEQSRWGGQANPSRSHSFGQSAGQSPQHTPYQPTMGNPDWDRSSSVYGSSSQEWGPAAQGYQRSDWSSRGEGSFGRSQDDWTLRRNRFDTGSNDSGPYYGRGPRGYQRSDDRIREDICDRLTRHGEIDATDVQIAVRSGEVTLDGMVDTRRAKRLAEDLAESVDGVRDVSNHLKTYRGSNDEQQGSSRDAAKRSASDAGLGNPGTPSTLGLGGSTGSTTNTGDSTSAGDKKR